MSTFSTSLLTWRMANKPIRVVVLGAASSVNLSQHTSLINKAWTSRHGLHDKELAHHNQANVNSENNVCASTPRFHDDDGTAPLPFGSASRKITMPSDRLSVFLHSTTLKRQTVTLDHEATFVETWHVQFQTTRQNRCLHGFGERRGALIPHLVVVETEDRPRWCWPCNASQKRPHNAANGSTHAATQRSTSVVKVPHRECHVRMHTI